MKKIIALMGLFLFSTLSLADILSVSIKNSSSCDCVLTQQFVLFGHVSDHTKIPEVIFRDQTATFLMREGKDHWMRSLLVYACGDDKEVALYTSQASGKVISAKNMQAHVTTENSSIFSLKDPWKIYWTLRD